MECFLSRQETHHLLPINMYISHLNIHTITFIYETIMCSFNMTWKNFSMKDNSLSVSHIGTIPTVYSLHWSECKVQQSQRLLTIIITITWHSLKVSSHTLNGKASMRKIHWAQLNAFNQSAELAPWNACPSQASCINPVGPIQKYTYMYETNKCCQMQIYWGFTYNYNQLFYLPDTLWY